MKPSRTYKDLIVWKKSIELSTHIYQSTKSFPREEIYGITAQIRRAIVSIACNIAEGQGRNTKGEFLQFLGIANGSISELETLLEISKELAFLSYSDYQKLINGCEEVHKLLHGLIRSMKSIENKAPKN